MRLGAQPDIQVAASVQTGSGLWQVLGFGLVGTLERGAQERHVINGSYQAAVALGSRLCFPPITLAGRKMGHRENGWNSMGQTLVFHL